MVIGMLLMACVPKGQLQAERLAHATTDRRLDSAQTEILALQRQLAAETSANTSLAERTESLDAKNAEMGTQLKEIGEQLAALSTRNATQAAQKTELEALLAAVNEDAAAASEEAKEARARAEALDVERTRLAKERATLAEEAERLRAEKVELQERTAEYDQLVGQLEAEIASGQVTITELSGKLTVNMSNAILFDSGAIAVKSEGKAALQKVAGVLSSVGEREIRVEGHTDNVPVGKGASYVDNWGLSAMRATTVVGLLIEGGVNPLSVAAVGYGEHRPAGANDTKEARAVNRRTEIVLVPKLTN